MLFYDYYDKPSIAIFWLFLQPSLPSLNGSIDSETRRYREKLHLGWRESKSLTSNLGFHCERWQGLLCCIRHQMKLNLSRGSSSTTRKEKQKPVFHKILSWWSRVLSLNSFFLPRVIKGSWKETSLTSTLTNYCLAELHTLSNPDGKSLECIRIIVTLDSPFTFALNLLRFFFWNKVLPVLLLIFSYSFCLLPKFDSTWEIKTYLSGYAC
jgi:hypothetical protein